MEMGHPVDARARFAENGSARVRSRASTSNIFALARARRDPIVSCRAGPILARENPALGVPGFPAFTASRSPFR